MNKSSDEVRELLEAHRDGALTAAMSERLHELLTDDETARQAFVQEQLIDAAFHLETSSIADAVALSGPVNTATRGRIGFRARKSWALAVAVGLTFLLGLGVGGLRKPAEPPAARLPEVAEPLDDGIALLTRSVDATWAGGVEPRPGSILSAGRLQLTGGLAHIEFYSGTQLILDGPVDLELVSANQAVCHSGRVRALVPPPARGFSMISPRFELVDLGTEFAIDVRSTGDAHVQVFDGEVRLFPADGKRSPEKGEQLFGGSGQAWLASGVKTALRADPASFPSFNDIRSQTEARARQRMAAWDAWNRSIAKDPRIAVRFDFEAAGRVLRDSGPTQSHGTIVGCERTTGRWADKGALEFKRPGDRVRVNIPGEFDALTLVAWIRVDARPDRHQGLLLTDGYEEGRPHWQISPNGELRLGVRVPAETPGSGAAGYGSPVLFKPRQFGVWCFVATVYDRRTGTVRHYFNGREVAAARIVLDQPLRIGAAEIGNWGVPAGKTRHPVRNFIGRMDELTLWKVALTESELHDMFQALRP